jgi:hypothetical protein
MQPLVIEYRMDGHERGYNYTSDTSAYSDETLKHVWRHAMPRGQGWGAPQYAEAQTLKCFTLPHSSEVAFSQISVTPDHDEQGRGGIRRAVIDVMPEREYADYLTQYMARYPASVQTELARLPTLSQRTRITSATLPYVRRSNRLVLARPYRDRAQWLVMEGMIIKLALSPPKSMANWGPIIPFTTLTLSAHDEGQILGLPADRVSEGEKVPMVRL